MRALLGVSHRQLALIAGAGALAALSLGLPSASDVGLLALSLAVVGVLALARSITVGWDRLIALILLVVLFVPIGRYRLPGSLPFNLELYRVVVALCILVWTASLLVDSRVRLQGTAFDRPLALIVVCVLGSEITNPGRVNAYGSYVIKSLTFLLSFILVYYLTAATIQRRGQAEMLLRVITASAAIIGVFAVVELRTHFNVFDHLHRVLPILQFQGKLSYLLLGGNLRVLGPSQQPIALGALLICIFPLAVYFARRFGWRWWVVAFLILLGALASGSRTAITMLVAEAVVFLLLKPNETKKLWPAVIPALAVIHFLMPGTIGGIKESFFPKGGIIAQQSKFEADYDPLLAGGRVRLIKPMLSEASGKPIFGEGYGTRLTGFDTPDRNAPILDNQWLNNALDVGFIGLAAWGWLMARAVRRLFRASRVPAHVDDDWLFAALAASVASFAVGMFTYDAFSYPQETFIFWFLLGLSAALLRISGARPASNAPTHIDSQGPRLS